MNVMFAEWFIQADYTECRFVECHYAKSRGTTVTVS
jgi:hypothetical protein